MTVRAPALSGALGATLSEWFAYKCLFVTVVGGRLSACSRTCAGFDYQQPMVYGTCLTPSRMIFHNTYVIIKRLLVCFKGWQRTVLWISFLKVTRLSCPFIRCLSLDLHFSTSCWTSTPTLSLHSFVSSLLTVQTFILCPTFYKNLYNVCDACFKYATVSAISLFHNNFDIYLNNLH